MCWGSLNLGPWEITFRRLSCWMIFRSPVITCPDGLYWKGEWEQRVLKVLFYVNILQCFFVVENFTANAVSVAIGDNGNKLIFEIWWNFFYDLFSIKNVADVNSIDSFVSKRNMEGNFLLLSWRGSDRTGLKRRKDATSHIILDNLYLGEKGSTPPLSSPKSLRSLR